jgi:Ca2+-binding EF-hand superfamily protein
MPVKRRSGLLVAASAAVVLVSCASEPKHRNWNPNGAPKYEDPSVTMIMKYDANHDGTLTRAELEEGLKADFDAFDHKHSGCLTDDQVVAINQARASIDQAAFTPLIDFKHNGCVDFDEFAAAPRSLFEQLDKNGDGKLTPDELRSKGQGNGEQTGAPRREHGHRGGGQGPD